MPVTVEDLYRNAAESGDWHFALWTTFLFDEKGDVAMPKNQHQRYDLGYKISVLAPYVKGHPYAETVCEKLLANLLAYDDAEHGGDALVLKQEDFDWLLNKLENQPENNPRLAKLLSEKAPWDK